MKGNNKRWRYVIIGMIIMMCLGTVYSWSIFRIPIEKHFEIDTVKSGYPYMVSLGVYALFVLIAGRFIENINQVRLWCLEDY